MYKRQAHQRGRKLHPIGHLQKQPVSLGQALSDASQQPGIFQFAQGGFYATPEFLQAIAYEVYVKNVTFGLLHQWLTDMGMTVSKNTLRNWLTKGKKYLDELVCVLKSIALEKDSIVNCDETWCKVRKYDHYKKCYIWVLVNKAQKTAIFFYENGSRGREVLTGFLGDAELKSNVFIQFLF